jgi:uncharacterized protein YukE
VSCAILVRTVPGVGVSFGRLSLEAGAQSRAARRVADEVPQVAGVLKDLATGLESASPGFAGAASAGLTEALRAWFEVAGQLPVALGRYASALAAADATAVGADASAATGLAEAASGSSGLNMGPAGPR